MILHLFKYCKSLYQTFPQLTNTICFSSPLVDKLHFVQKEY